eukprot:750163-Hanusia_phi.AAC.9
MGGNILLMVGGKGFKDGYPTTSRRLPSGGFAHVGNEDRGWVGVAVAVTEGVGVDVVDRETHRVLRCMMEG